MTTHGGHTPEWDSKAWQEHAARIKAEYRTPMENEFEDEVDFRPGHSSFEDLEHRIEELEAKGSSGGHETGISIAYALGMSIAVVLSWSRNASILWCIFHGLFSWGYVLYFAWTR